MHCLYGGYNLHRFSDALGLILYILGIFKNIYVKYAKSVNFISFKMISF